jgi:sugar fermentation stimulation protein A
LDEIKSVVSVINTIALFPDASTERGRKHLVELINAQKEGYRTGVVFVVQRNDIESFQPNSEMDLKFSSLLVQCHSIGMDVLAFSCDIDGVNIKIIGELSVNV